MEPSDEQRLVIEALRENNVVVNSVAGSGKTTTVMFIAKQYTKSQILLLTYNTILAKETRERLSNENIKNVTVYTYHAFAGRTYGRICANDVHMQEIITELRDPHHFVNPATPRYSVVILDEVQDMTPTYYEFIMLYLRDHPAKRYCIVGDVNQNIYEFNRADSRFLSYADKLFDFNDLPFKLCKLSTSYRVTSQIANFINRVYLKNNRIRAIKEGPPVNYILHDNYQAAAFYDKYMVPILAKYNSEDVFILAPSIRDKSPIAVLANYISDHKKTNIYIPNSDTEPFDEDAARNKIAFSSFHQSKGRERKCAIIYGVDASYIKYYTKGLIPTKCPNAIYVALTRAKELLVIVHSNQYDFLPFSNPFVLTEVANCIKTTTKTIIREVSPMPPKVPDSVTGLLRHHPSDIIAECDKMILGWQTKTFGGDAINMQTKIQFGNNVEMVGDVIGTAVVLYYEFMRTGTCSVIDYYKNAKTKSLRYNFHDTITKYSDRGDIVREIVHLAIHHISSVSGYTYKKTQISNLDWIEVDMFNQTNERIQALNLGRDVEFEKHIKYTSDKIIICGATDIIDHTNKIVYELKFVSELTDIHRLQLAVYGAALCALDPKYRDYKYCLYNIRVGQMLTLNGLENFGEILRALINSKLTISHLPIDDAFLNMINRIRNRPCDLEADPDISPYMGENDDETNDADNIDNSNSVTMDDLMDMMDDMDLESML